MIVLCIDDDPEDIEFFCEALKEINPAATCLSALEGNEALDLLSSISNDQKMPDYIFLDINMPRMDGKATLRAIRKMDRCKSVKIVMLSTALNPKYANEYLQLGANHLMPKATSFQDLCDQLRTFFKTERLN